MILWSSVQARYAPPLSLRRSFNVRSAALSNEGAASVSFQLSSYLNELTPLQEPFLNLRQCWPRAWPGLVQVLRGCLLQLCGPAGSSPSKPKLAAQRLQACLWDVAALVEQDGHERAALGTEPAYHNRLHVADTLVALTLLLRALRSLQAPPESEQPSHPEWLALLAMLAHDLMHDGRINREPGEMETRSFQTLQPLMRHHRVASADQAAVQHMILMTEVTQVAPCHLKMAGRPFSIHDLDALVVLVQEADIWVSSLPVLGEQITQQLSQEWWVQAPESAQALLQPAGRLGFLRSAALFTSPAARALGMPEIRQSQINALEEI